MIDISSTINRNANKVLSNSYTLLTPYCAITKIIKTKYWFFLNSKKSKSSGILHNCSFGILDICSRTDLPEATSVNHYYYKTVVDIHRSPTHSVSRNASRILAKVKNNHLVHYNAVYLNVA